MELVELEHIYQRYPAAFEADPPSPDSASSACLTGSYPLPIIDMRF